MGFFGRRRQSPTPPPFDPEQWEMPLNPNTHFWVQPLGATVWTAFQTFIDAGATAVFTQMEVNPALAAQLKIDLQPFVLTLPNRNIIMPDGPDLQIGSHAIRIDWEPMHDSEQISYWVDYLVNSILGVLCQRFSIDTPQVEMVDGNSTTNLVIKQLERNNTWYT